MAGTSNLVLRDENVLGRNYREALASVDPDAMAGVLVAVSTSAHYDVAAHLLERGFRRLLIEKPMTETLVQAEALARLARSVPDALVLVGHTLIYDPAYRAMKAAATRIGTIREVHYTSLKAPAIESGNLLPDAGSPPIYLFMDIAGAKPATVSVRPRADDNVDLVMEFESGIRGTARIGTIFPERKREIVLVGDEGRLMIDEFVGPRELVFIDGSGRRETLPFPAELSALQAELLEFEACLKRGTQPPTSVAEGVAVVEVVAAAKESLRLGGAAVALT